MSDSTLSTVRRILAEFGKDFAWAPVDWIVLGLLVIAVAGNWQKGRELTRACDMLVEDKILSSVSLAQKDEIAAICVKLPPAE